MVIAHATGFSLTDNLRFLGFTDLITNVVRGEQAFFAGAAQSLLDWLEFVCKLESLLQFAQWVAEWVVNKDKAGDADCFDDVLGAADNYGGNAVGFEVAGDQTHGLMADRSNRHEQHYVHVVFTGPSQNRLSVCLGASL